MRSQAVRMESERACSFLKKSRVGLGVLMYASIQPWYLSTARNSGGTQCAEMTQEAQKKIMKYSIRSKANLMTLSISCDIK